MRTRYLREDVKHNLLTVVLAGMHYSLLHLLHPEYELVLRNHPSPEAWTKTGVRLYDVATPPMHCHRVYLAGFPRQIGVYTVTSVAATQVQQQVRTF
jgi:hypothetical protein